MNPTFAYSLAGEGCAVHYGTDPLTPFHFSALFGNSRGTPTATDMVKFAKEKFSDWCATFRNVASDSGPGLSRKLPATSRDARAQLAFLLELSDDLSLVCVISLNRLWILVRYSCKPRTQRNSRIHVQQRSSFLTSILNWFLSACSVRLLASLLS